MFQIKTYQQRRNRLRSQVKSGLILLLGNNESPMNYADKDFGGCRNEENYVITETGARLLGKSLPKSPEAAERERQKAF